MYTLSYDFIEGLSSIYSVSGKQPEQLQKDFLPMRCAELENENLSIGQEMQQIFFDKDTKWLSIQSMDKKMHRIIDEIYLGDIYAYEEWVQKANQHPNERSMIISVVNVEMKIQPLNNVEHLTLDISDDYSAWLAIDGIKEKLKSVFQLIDRARMEKKALLIHCLAGRSRSATFLAAYLMWACRQRSHVVLPFIQSKRWQADPCVELKSILAGDYQQMLIEEGILT